MPKKIAIIAILAIALVALAGAAVYIAQQRQDKEAEKVRQEEPVATIPEKSEIDTSNWKTYSGYGISFKYPGDFKVESKEGLWGSFCIKITSPKASPVSSEELRKAIKSYSVFALPLEIRYLPYTIQIIHLTPDFLLHFDKFSLWGLKKPDRAVLTCPSFYHIKELRGGEMEEISLSGVKVKKIKYEYHGQTFLEVRPISFLYPDSKYGFYRIRGSYLKDEINFEETFDRLISTLKIEKLIQGIPEASEIEKRLEEIERKVESTK